MKAFFEEYGLAIIIAIVILLLVVMASPIGGAIKTALNTAVTNLSSTTGSAQTEAGKAISGINWNTPAQP